MNKYKIAILLVSILPTLCHASEKVTVHTGFITGNTFLTLEPTSKNIYATGLIDGILLAPFYGAPGDNLKYFETCATGMPVRQVVAIFEKYLKENPEGWHRSMHVLGHLAMKQACRK